MSIMLMALACTKFILRGSCCSLIRDKNKGIQPKPRDEHNSFKTHPLICGNE